MKMQLNIADPAACADANTTVVMGVALIDMDIKDYSTTPLILMPSHDGIKALCGLDFNNTLLDHYDWPEGIKEASFHSVLKLPVWHKTECGYPSGEIAFVKTSIPTEGLSGHAYVFFGMVRGKDLANLKRYSEQVMEFHDPLAEIKGALSVQAKSGNPVIKAEHVMGCHLLDALNQPIWGFSGERYAMSSDISDQTYDEFKIEHAKVIETQTHPSRPDFARYLIAMKEQNLHDLPLWQSKDVIEEVSKASFEITKRIYTEDILKSNATLLNSLTNEGPGA